MDDEFAKKYMLVFEKALQNRDDAVRQAEKERLRKGIEDGTIMIRWRFKRGEPFVKFVELVSQTNHQTDRAMNKTPKQNFESAFRLLSKTSRNRQPPLRIKPSEKPDSRRRCSQWKNI